MLALKARQKWVMEAVVARFNTAAASTGGPPVHHQSHETLAFPPPGGRFELREYRATAEPGWWLKTSRWEGL